MYSLDAGEDEVPGVGRLGVRYRSVPRCGHVPYLQRGEILANLNPFEA